MPNLPRRNPANGEVILFTAGDDTEAWVSCPDCGAVIDADAHCPECSIPWDKATGDQARTRAEALPASVDESGSMEDFLGHDDNSRSRKCDRCSKAWQQCMCNEGVLLRNNDSDIDNALLPARHNREPGRRYYERYGF